MDFARIRQAAEGYQAAMTKFCVSWLRFPGKAAARKATSAALLRKWKT